VSALFIMSKGPFSRDAGHIMLFRKIIPTAVGMDWSGIYEIFYDNKMQAKCVYKNSRCL